MKLINKRVFLIGGLLLSVWLCPLLVHAETADDAQNNVIIKYPDQTELAEIVNLGLNFKYDEAFSRTKKYQERFSKHPCGAFLMGLMQEWYIEPQFPEPSLQPAIMAYEQAANMSTQERPDLLNAGDVKSYDATAAICRGGSLIHLTRIYFKYGKSITAARRAVAASHTLEDVAKVAPRAYDVYAYLGAYHYFTDHQPAAARFIMRLFGMKGNRLKGLQELQLAWKKAPLFAATAGQTLYNIRTEHENDFETDQDILPTLVERYPDNLVFKRLYERSKNRLASSQSYQH